MQDVVPIRVGPIFHVSIVMKTSLIRKLHEKTNNLEVIVTGSERKGILTKIAWPKKPLTSD